MRRRQRVVLMADLKQQSIAQSQRLTLFGIVYDRVSAILGAFALLGLATQIKSNTNWLQDWIDVWRYGTDAIYYYTLEPILDRLFSYDLTGPQKDYISLGVITTGATYRSMRHRNEAAAKAGRTYFVYYFVISAIWAKTDSWRRYLLDFSSLFISFFYMAP